MYGYGVLHLYQDGSLKQKYEGEMNNSMFNGKGRLTVVENNVRITGYFVDQLPSGEAFFEMNGKEYVYSCNANTRHCKITRDLDQEQNRNNFLKTLFGAVIGFAIIAKGTSEIGKWLYKNDSSDSSSSQSSSSSSSSSSPQDCDAVWDECFDICEKMSDAHGSFLYPSPRSRCEWRCGNARSACEDGRYTRMKQDLCHATCQGLSDYNSHLGVTELSSEGKECQSKCVYRYH